MADKARPPTGERSDMIEWPETLLREPDFPDLQVQHIDLACDAIVFKAPYDPNDF